MSRSGSEEFQLGSGSLQRPSLVKPGGARRCPALLKRSRARRHLLLVRCLLGLAVVVAAVSQTVVLTGCSSGTEHAPSADAQFRIPLFSPSSNRYELQDVAIESFSDPEKLRGDAAVILVDPTVDGGTLSLKEPIGRFLISGNVWTPADFASLQATVIYAHTERLLKIDQSLGLRSHMNGPEKIAIQSRIAPAPTSSALVFNNAVYDGRLDALFIVPYERTELPISLNAGVIAHEHFHRVFQGAVLKSLKMKNGAESIGLAGEPCATRRAQTWDESLERPLERPANSQAGGESGASAVSKADADAKTLRRDVNRGLVPTRTYNQVVLRALNEGLADFWGWSYSMDDDFIGRSLGERESQVRRLDKTAAPLMTKEEIRSNLVNRSKEQDLVSVSYRIGTYYSRFLRSLVEAVAESGVARLAAVGEVRRALAGSLGGLSEQVAAAWSEADKELEPDAIVAPIAKILAKSALLRGQTEKLCQRLRALVPNTSGDDAPQTFDGVCAVGGS